MSLYPPASFIEYKVPASVKDSLLAALLVRRETDRNFTENLRDSYISKIFCMQLGHEIAQQSKRKLSVRLAIIMIVNGLKNRILFAIEQKERLLANFAYMDSHPFPGTLVGKVDYELEQVIRVAVHFIEYDDHLDQLLKKASMTRNIKKLPCIKIKAASE